MYDTGWLNYIEGRMAAERYSSGNPEVDEKLRNNKVKEATVDVSETGVIGPCMSSINYKEKELKLVSIREKK